MEQSFSVTLLSNVKSFAENSVSSFKTLLPKKINLSGIWEVALSEISFTRTWYNLSEEQTIYMYTADGIVNEEPVKIPAGNYSDVENLLAIINGKIETYKALVHVLPRLSYISHSQKVVVFLGKTKKRRNNIYVRISDELKYMLGFISEVFTGSNHFVEKVEEDNRVSLLPTTSNPFVAAENPIDLKAGIHSLFVYSDIIEPTIVGDVYAQLLKSVTIPNESHFGDQCRITYVNPNYIPLLTNEFETIKIDIKDDTGSDVLFQYGRVIITLLFRRWKNII